MVTVWVPRAFSDLNVNAQNRGTHWTPLHAAAFQEHGPVRFHSNAWEPQTNRSDPAINVHFKAQIISYTSNASRTHRTAMYIHHEFVRQQVTSCVSHCLFVFVFGQIIKLLLERGAQPELPDSEGRLV